MNDGEMVKIERRGLLISAGCSLLIGGTGVVFSFLIGAQVILLDGVFNLTFFATVCSP